MFYDVYQTKKFLRKNRVQIALGLLGFVIVTALIVHLIGNLGNNNETQDDGFLPQTTGTNQENKNKEKPAPTVTTNVDTYQILNSHVRHGKQYYTQGLLFKDANTLIESGGLTKESVIHYVNLKDMTIGLEAKLDNNDFGEGCELYDNNGQEEIYQLTWQTRRIYVWDAKDLTQKRIINLPQPIREGWGIAKRFESDENGKSSAVFYISDGSDKIYVVDPQTFNIKRSFTVMKSGKTTDKVSVEYLNELEFVQGKLWANVYMTNDVVVIDPETGFVEYVIDFSKLQKLAQEKAKELSLTMRRDYVLNGIAYDAKNDKLMITGKKWPLVWEIRVNGIY